MIDDLFKSRVGVILLSIIWGLGLSALFRKSCEGRKCHVIVYSGPDPKEMKNAYFDYGTGSCYKYEPYMTDCDT